jgi:hypothetical protein
MRDHATLAFVKTPVHGFTEPVISGDKCKLAPRGFFGRCKSELCLRE